MISYYYPTWQYIIDHKASDGEMPLWNDSILCGTTLIGNAHFSFYYPVNSLFYIMPFPQALHIWYAFHIFIAGLGCYIFLKKQNLQRISAIYGSIIYMFGAHIAMRINIGHYDMVAAIAWVPFSFLFLNKLLDETNLKNSLYFGFFLGVHLLTMHLQIFYITLIGLAVFALSKLLWAEKKDRLTLRKSVKLGYLSIISGFIAVCLSSAQLLSILQVVPYSHRTEITYEIFSKLSLPPMQLFGLFFPDMWGTDSSYIGAKNYWELSCFIGFSAIFVLVWAFSRKNIIVRSMAITGIVSIIFSVGRYTPFGALLYKMPFMSYSRIPARMMIITIFSLAVCCGFGLDNLIKYLKERKKKKTDRPFIILAIISILTILLYLMSFIGDGGLILKIFNPGGDNPAQAISFLRMSILKALIVITVIWIFYLLYRFKIIKPVIMASGLTLLLFAELMIYNLPLIRLTTIPEIEKGYDFFKGLKESNQTEKFRVCGVPFIYQRGLNIYGIERFDGYEPLVEKNLFIIDSGIKQLLDLTNSEFMRFHANAMEMANTKYLVMFRKLGRYVENCDRIGIIEIQGTKFLLFKTKDPNPRAYFADTLVKGEDINDFYKFVLNRDYKQAVYNENQVKEGLGKIEDIKDVQYLPNKVTIRFNAPTDGVVVLSDVLFPGWNAYLDKQKTDILHVNYAFMGVKVTPGEHVLEFKYEPGLLNIGKIISLITMTVLILLCLMGTVTHYRRKTKANG